jgi:antitoxin YefM
MMTTLTATAARKGFFELLKKTNEQHEVFHIHHRSGDAVLLSEAEYDSLNESLALLSSPGFREDFRKSRKQAENDQTVSFEEVFGEAQ